MKLSEAEVKGMAKGKDEAIRFVKNEKKVYQLHNALLQIGRKNCEENLEVYEVKVKEAEDKKKKVVAEEKERLAKQA